MGRTVPFIVPPKQPVYLYFHTKGKRSISTLVLLIASFILFLVKRHVKVWNFSIIIRIFFHRLVNTSIVCNVISKLTAECCSTPFILMRVLEDFVSKL